MNILKSSLLTIFAGVSFCPQALGNGFAGPFNGFSNLGVGGAGMAGGKISDGSSATLNPTNVFEAINQITFSVGPEYQRQKLNTTSSSINLVLTSQGGPAFPPHNHPLKNKNQFFPASLGGVTHQVNDQLVTGVALTGFSWTGGGGFVRYKENPISPAMPHISKSFNLAAMVMPFSLAFQPTPCQTYGVSMIVGIAGIQTNLAKPTNPFKETSGHNHLKLAGGLGTRIGGKWNLTQQLAFGASVSSPVYFTKFDKYTDVLPHRIELPMQVGGGLTWRFLPTTEFLVDVNGYLWRLSKITRKTPSHGGFGWRNTAVVMTGINHRINDMVTVRGGYQYSMTPIKKKFVFENIFAPAYALVENHITAGLKVDITPCLSLEGEVAYGFQKKLKDSGRGPFGGFTRNITFKASEIFTLFGFTWKY